MSMRSDWIWTQSKRLPPFTWLGKLDWEYIDIEDAGQADNGSGDASRITPDAEEPDYDAVTVAPAKPTPAKPLKQPKHDALYIAWHAKMDAMLKFGRYAAQTVNAYANFDNLFAARMTR